MQLIYKEEVTKLQRNETAIEAILTKVSHLIDEKELVFSHLIIDGQDIYENHEEIIKNRINEIERIEIVMYTTKEMIWETLQTVDEYFVRAIPTLNELIDETYDQFSEQTWLSIGQLVEGLEWLFKFKNFTDSATTKPSHWDEFAEAFETCEVQFAPLLEAMETQDMVLISDILSYEILPTFEQLSDITKQILQDKNYLKDNH